MVREHDPTLSIISAQLAHFLGTITSSAQSLHPHQVVPVRRLQVHDNTFEVFEIIQPDDQAVSSQENE